MIVVSVGTLHYPFDRLMQGLRGLPPEELVVQHGTAEPPPGVARAVPFMPLDELVAAIRTADAVVTHAGCGSIFHATRAGHTPVVVPRLKRYGEHVDDHQLELTRHLGAEGKVVPVLDVAELSSAIAALPPRQPPRENVAGPLHRAVRAAILA